MLKPTIGRYVANVAALKEFHETPTPASPGSWREKVLKFIFLFFMFFAPLEKWDPAFVPLHVTPGGILRVTFLQNFLARMELEKF